VRSVPATLFVFLLLLMLAVTTPTGTGDSVHESTLLHPLFSHSHVIDGRIVTHQQLESGTTTTSGPAFGASGGAAAMSLDVLPISPTLPLRELLLSQPPNGRYTNIEGARPESLTTRPPHPPPTSPA
jgi:hypothetical protein